MRGLLAVAVALSGCLSSPLVPCGDLYCAPGSVCVANTCASPADVAACEGHADGDACRAANGGGGTCENGVCHTGLCGNGQVDVGEACDDGNQVSGDGCRGDCGKVEICGDGQLDQGEACDDGNHNAADGCDMCVKTVWNVSTAVGTETIATQLALADPHEIAVDGQGRVFVADTLNNRVLRVETDGSITKIAGTGTPGFSGDGGEATSAELQAPNAVAVDGIGRVFVADTQNSRIREIDLDGTIATIAGTGTPGGAGDNGPALLAQLSNPTGIAVDGLGRILIADSDLNTIRRIDIDGTIATIAGTGIADYTGDQGPATAATLSGPFGVSVDSSGRILIADTGNAVVRRVDANGVITTIAGTGTVGYSGDGGPAVAADLAFPVVAVEDSAGRVVVADSLNQRVRAIDSGGTITTIAGNGTRGFSGDGAAATAAQLQNPQGLAVSAAGVVIADTSNERIRMVNTGGNITTIAGNGTFGLGGDGGLATAATLQNPFDCAIDPMGRIYIADVFNQRIRRVELDGTITTIAGTGLQGFSGDGGPATSAELFEPDGVALDAQGRLYIADSVNNRVRMVDTSGVISTVAGDGNRTTLDHPHGVAIDLQGRLVIADTYNHRVRRVDSPGTLTTIAGNGGFGFSGDGGPATSATLSTPYYVAVDSTGRVLISDLSNNRIRRVELDSTIDTAVGNGAASFGGDGGPATSGSINQPYKVATDAQDTIYIADELNQRIRKVTAGGTLSTIAGNGSVGTSGDAAPATSAQLQFPLGVCAGPGGIAVADTNNNRIRRIDPGTGVLTTVAGQVDPEGVGASATARLADPQGFAVGSMFTFVAGGSSGTVEALRTGHLTAVAGRYPQSSATGALARFRTAGFGRIGGIAVDDSAHVVYITETSANRLHVITEVDPTDPSTWTIATLANTSGTAGFADGAAATARFRGPTGLYLDAAASTLYIADTGNHAIRALDLSAHTVSTIVNTSHALGFAGDGGPAAGALLFEPTALTRCPNGDLFIADTGNNRIRRVASGTITTVLGDGVPASSGEGAPARTFPVDQPRGLSCDAFGDLFVTSATTVRLLPASDAGVVDGSGVVQTIYGKPPHTAFPASVTACLTGLAVTGAAQLQVADACTGLLVQLDRAPAP
ncbi:MAG: hypothetical protein JO257_05020 [Deltaproteobacteria bacterium]|nr:hypothetical protein [Deltaproteobacteria bacterium]